MTITRGMVANTAGNQLFIVVDNLLFSVSPQGIRTQLGILNTRFGTVGVRIGLNQLVIVDGSYGYVYSLQTKVFSRITDDYFQGSYTVEYIGGYFSFIALNSQEFYISAFEDATTGDPLDFASANQSPDKLVGQKTTSNIIWYLGEDSGEIWQLDPQATLFALERNTGASLDVGLLGAFTTVNLDETIFFLGRDRRGAGLIYKLSGVSPVRVSTQAIEEKIQEAISAGNDLTKSIAYGYQQAGHSFYVLQVPGLDTTLCYDAATQQWHERAELIDGEFKPHRGNYYAYCYGRHLVAGDDGIINEYDVDANTNAGDPLCRTRTSPHYASPQLDRLFFSRFELDCVVGYGKSGQTQANVMLRYSNDGGFSWSSWRTATLGAVGQKSARARFLRCGSGRDRVWEVRTSDDVPFAIINAVIEASSGDN